MPGQSVSTIGIEMPQDFSVKPYEAIKNRLIGKKDTHSDSWDEFAFAWNAVAYRFRSCTEHDEAFTESIRRHGKTLPPSERYVQERALFCFFVTGVSTIESLCYGLFAIGSMLDAQNFLFVTPDDRRNVSPEETTDKFGTVFPRENITATLKRMTKMHDYQDWKVMRNILSHRSTPGRLIFRGGDRDGDVLWGETILIDENTTISRRRWLAKMVSDLLDAADVFTAARFV